MQCTLLPRIPEPDVTKWQCLTDVNKRCFSFELGDPLLGPDIGEGQGNAVMPYTLAIIFWRDQMAESILPSCKTF